MNITIDQYSVSTVPIEMFFDKTQLSVATSFVWETDSEKFLITNWHNVSGIDPFTGKHLSTTAAEPNSIRGWWNVAGQLGNKFPEQFAIRDQNGQPLWFVHPQLGNQVDVAVLPATRNPQADLHPINQMSADALAIQIGMDVFVLGYPFGISQSGFPIWKRGSIASEPQVLDPQHPYVLIDTASRPGMSGSPVIRRSWNTHMYADGSLQMGQFTATTVFGIYSGHLRTNDPLDAQLGLAWPVHLIEEIIAGRQRDS